MAHPITVEIVSADRKVYNGNAVSVVIPGSAGYFGVLHGHAPLISTLAIGLLELRATGNAAPTVFAISGGFVEVTPDKVVVLADSAESTVEIDAERAKLAATRAEERLRLVGPDIDYERAQAALLRAINRLRAIGHL